MEQLATGHSRSDKIFNAVNYIVLLLIMISVLYPLIFVVSSSFSSTRAVMSGQVWLWPVEPTLAGYKAVFEYQQIWTGFANTVYYTVVGTLVCVILTIMAAYPLSRSEFYGGSFFMKMFVFTLMFVPGLIPSYLLAKDLGLLDTRLAMIIAGTPGALSIANTIIMRTYFKTGIPKELMESAHIDGCSDFKFLIRIVLPLSGPIIAVIALFYAVMQWNQYFNALIYLYNKDLFPLQVVLRDILIRNEVDISMLSSNIKDAVVRDGLRELLKYSLIVVSSAPLLLIYPFVQKYFVKGIMIGSLKG